MGTVKENEPCDGFWLWRDGDGRLWLMYGPYRLSRQAETVSELDEAT
jgi:hypothetical protein